MWPLTRSCVESALQFVISIHIPYLWYSSVNLHNLQQEARVDKSIPIYQMRMKPKKAKGLPRVTEFFSRHSRHLTPVLSDSTTLALLTAPWWTRVFCKNTVRSFMLVVPTKWMNSQYMLAVVITYIIIIISHFTTCEFGWVFGPGLPHTLREERISTSLRLSIHWG